MSIINRTYRFLFLTLLLAVYTAFFSVQVFYNIEAFSNTGVFSRYAQVDGPLKDNARLVQGNTQLIKKSTTNTARVSFRLNLRFLQQHIPPCQTISVVIPIRYLPFQSSGSYRDPYLPAVVPLCTLLRGPPVKA
jgi:hypothetical protein